MAQAETVEPLANRRAVDLEIMRRLDLVAQLSQRQLALLGQPGLHPTAQVAQLAVPRAALALRLEPDRLASQVDHVVHEFWRDAEVTCCSAMRMSFIDMRDNPLAQLYWMWFAHL